MRPTAVITAIARTRGRITGTFVAVLVATACGTTSPAVTGAAGTSPPVPLQTASNASSVASPSLDATATFEVDGRVMTIECRGSGSPTLIFLVGTGFQRTQMRGLEDGFGDHYRVCDYERSDSPGALEDEHVKELADLLHTAAVPSPYVLVGQSVGGNIAWLYASRYPEDVGGFLAMNPGPFVLDRETMAKVWTPEEMAAEFPAKGSLEEKIGATLQAATPPVGVPYVIMLSTIAQCDDPTDICGRFYPAYEAWGREIAARTPQGRFVEVAAPHEIFATRPDAVIAEITRIVDVVSPSSPVSSPG